jgi:2-amino-4-hydroxy-6-hydroxymethyldihydropteridine diphosphokinase
MCAAGPPQGARLLRGERSEATLRGEFVYIGLGSNLAHPRGQLARALRRIARLPATTLVAVSPNYLTAPLGTPDPQPEYVNAVAQLRTSLAPRALLARLLALERRQHRRRGADVPRNAARTLDLDLLLYGRRRLRTPALTLPHPRMHERAFVLRPLTDVSPAAVIPGHGLARRRLRDVRGQRIRRTHRRALP